VTLEARRARRWSEEETRWLLLENHVRLKTAGYGFSAEAAVVRIRPVPGTSGVTRELAIYFREARALPGRGGIRAGGSRLLVTLATRGAIELETDLFEPGDPAEHALAREAAERLEAFDQRLAEGLLQRSPETAPTGPARPPEAPPRPSPGESPPAPPPETPGAPAPTPAPVPPAPREAAILPPDGTVDFHADRIVFEPSREGEDGHVLLTGGVSIAYRDPAGERTLTLRAEQAVAFVRSGGLEGLAQSAPAEAVTGLYLEQNVIVRDGDYTVRAPRVFYDPQANRAVLLEAVLYAWHPRRRIPVYLRAEALRQRARRSWEAEEARITTSAFARPHLAIGASRITVEAGDEAAGGVDRFVAEEAGIHVGGQRVLAWPRLSGRSAEDLPLRRLSVGAIRDDGSEVEFRSTWDLFSLSGRTAPDGTRLDGLLDVRGDHGVGLGVDLDYDQPGLKGSFEAYALPHDDGTDDPGGREDIEFDGDFRGRVRLEHLQQLDPAWELRAEGSFISDPSFLEEFEREEALAGRTQQNRLTLTRRDETSAFTVEASQDASDFVPQLSALQAPGHLVEKLPEIRWHQFETELLGGRLSWFSENRLSRLRISAGDDDPEDRGFDDAQAQAFFGLPDAETDFGDAADRAGFPTDHVLRLDTRQQIAAPLQLGPVDAVPYLLGRITLYDDDFEAFGGNDDKVRFLGGGGLRLGAAFHRTYENARSGIFNLHRLRHLVEPRLHLAWLGSSLDPGELPVLEPDVEGVQDGFSAALGLRQTLQTQRGGPGRRHSVDWLVWDNELVLRSDDTDRDTRLGRFFDHRPELSRGGDHFNSRLMWQVSEAASLTSEGIASLERDRLEQWRIGMNLRHTPRLASWIDYLETDAFDTRLLSAGFDYELTSRYDVSFLAALDLQAGEGRTVEGRLVRHVPQGRWIVSLSHDEIDDEQVFGITFRPAGFGDPTSQRFFR